MLLDLFYPPLCSSCEERCTTKVLCSDCWAQCGPPDPVGRCTYCFTELEEKEELCKQCREEKVISAIRAFVFDPESPAHLLGFEKVEAMAGFALLQWIQLDWPYPDVIVPMPDSKRIAFAVAKALETPFVQALNFSHEYYEDRLEEGQIILLFDVSNQISDLQKATRSLARSCPKIIYLLSLLPDLRLRL